MLHDASYFSLVEFYLKNVTACVAILDVSLISIYSMINRLLYL